MKDSGFMLCDISKVIKMLLTRISSFMISLQMQFLKYSNDKTITIIFLKQSEFKIQVMIVSYFLILDRFLYQFCCFAIIIYITCLLYKQRDVRSSRIGAFMWRVELHNPSE